MVGVTGAYGSLQYKSETSFKTVDTSDTAKVYGRGQKITSLNIKQNLELIYELGVRTAQKGVFKQFEGTLTVEWILANPWFLRYLLGTAADAGGPSYTHTYTKANTLPTAQIKVGVDFATDVVRKFAGVVLNTVTMTASVNELLKVRGEFMFAKEYVPVAPAGTVAVTSGSAIVTGTGTNFTQVFEVGDYIEVGVLAKLAIITVTDDTHLTCASNFGTTVSAQTYKIAMPDAIVDSYDPFSFEHATLELPNGTTIAEVQSFEFTINNNVQMIWGLGNKEAVAFVPQALELTGRLNVTFQSSAILDYVKNRAEITNLKLTITNSASGTSLRSFVIQGTGILFDEHSTTLEPNVLIMQDVPIRIRDITNIVATDATATEP